jgi:DNA repair photolyase
MTLTTFDEELCKILEPNVSTTKERFETLKIFNQNDIPTIVWITPILPFINDSEENLRGILSYCIEAKVKGIICFNIGVTLREGDREYFYSKLDEHFPRLKKDYQRIYGEDYVVLSPNNDRLMRMFNEECTKHGIMTNVSEIFNYIQAFDLNDTSDQLSLF